MTRLRNRRAVVAAIGKCDFSDRSLVEGKNQLSQAN
jgi:ribosomal protein L1